MSLLDQYIKKKVYFLDIHSLFLESR